jgi:hypothetical protein
MKANSSTIKKLYKPFARMLSVGLVFLVFAAAHPQHEVLDYREHFGKNDEFAQNFIRQHFNLFLKTFHTEEDARMAAAIVFPELIRYNALRDKIETGALRALYVQYGARYANFSIGPFQMKPDFAEKVETEWDRTNLPLCMFPDTLQDGEKRSIRVTRLSTVQGQMTYLLMFYQLMEKRFAQHVFHGKEEKIRIYATAYNAGFGLPYHELYELSQKKQFHTSLFKSNTTQLYAYCDIAIDYYRSIKSLFRNN